MVYDSVPFTAFFGAANITIWLYQRRVGDLDHLVWPIKKISSTIPANICCMLSIKVGRHLWLWSGHIGANNLFPNVMQIEKYLFSFLFVVYPETRIYRWDGLALRGRRSTNCQGGIIKSNQRKSVFPSLISSFIWEKQVSGIASGTI